ncbi:hypothetical protein A2Y83_05255 [Candidatus Falkowbacteria bacterium RBG_13_39_14]|uniref:Uncharacterized protein n=1 Tax=Candidatus Falkowbacteria bacterium RBG_13_39_14 TaxID=1797985 RepID=A0A1F5S533_9BACT|nr:MAG: hypothetical protein A2Y83_05255 [Candidatus Falkowbacteria bacterium RBG_13_39_14]
MSSRGITSKCAGCARRKKMISRRKKIFNVLNEGQQIEEIRFFDHECENAEKMMAQKLPGKIFLVHDLQERNNFLITSREENLIGTDWEIEFIGLEDYYYLKDPLGSVRRVFCPFGSPSFSLEKGILNLAEKFHSWSDFDQRDKKEEDRNLYIEIPEKFEPKLKFWRGKVYVNRQKIDYESDVLTFAYRKGRLFLGGDEDNIAILAKLKDKGWTKCWEIPTGLPCSAMAVSEDGHTIFSVDNHTYLQRIDRLPDDGGINVLRVYHNSKAGESIGTVGIITINNDGTITTVDGYRNVRHFNAINLKRI